MQKQVKNKDNKKHITDHGWTNAADHSDDALGANVQRQLQQGHIVL